MKNLALIAITGFCFCLLSCNNSTDGTSGTGSDSSANKNKQASVDIIKGIETGDSSKLNLIADDGVDHMGPNGTELKGGDSIRWMLKDMHNYFNNDLKIEVLANAADGDYVMTWTRMTGTVSKPFMGAPAGMKMDSRGVDVIRFRDGKAVEHWGYLDPKDMMQSAPPTVVDSVNKK